MKFVREIPLTNVTKTMIDDLSNYGFTLVYTTDSIIVYADCSAEESASRAPYEEKI